MVGVLAELKLIFIDTKQHDEKAKRHIKLLLWSSVAFVFALVILSLIFYLVQIYPVNQIAQLGINLLQLLLKYSVALLFLLVFILLGETSQLREKVRLLNVLLGLLIS